MFLGDKMIISTEEKLLLQILEIGIVAIRNMAYEDTGGILLRVESEHLHNIPGYIKNRRGLLSYYNNDRMHYLKSIDSINEWAASIQAISYPLIWGEMIRQIGMQNDA